MKIIEVRPCKRFKGVWVSFEVPGVEPAFAAPDAKQKAIDYACQRFSGSAGEVYGEDAVTLERSIVIDGRGQYPQVGAGSICKANNPSGGVITSAVLCSAVKAGSRIA